MQYLKGFLAASLAVKQNYGLAESMSCTFVLLTCKINHKSKKKIKWSVFKYLNPYTNFFVHWITFFQSIWLSESYTEYYFNLFYFYSIYKYSYVRFPVSEVISVLSKDVHWFSFQTMTFIV